VDPRSAERSALPPRRGDPAARDAGAAQARGDAARRARARDPRTLLRLATDPARHAAGQLGRLPAAAFATAAEGDAGAVLVRLDRGESAQGARRTRAPRSAARRWLARRRLTARLGSDSQLPRPRPRRRGAASM